MEGDVMLNGLKTVNGFTCKFFCKTWVLTIALLVMLFSAGPATSAIAASGVTAIAAGAYNSAALKSDGSVARSNQLTINPGFRFAIDHKRTQIVPGISAPFIFVDGKFDRGGLFFYLSFEPEYLPFTKPKTR